MTEEIKKGNKSWKPSHHLPIRNAPPGYRPKWAWDDPGNIERLEAEGWKHPGEIGQGTKVERTDRREIEDGKNLTASEKKYRELRLMYLPEEDYEARTEYFKQKTEAQTAGMKKNLERDLRDGSDKPAAVRGKITIE